MLWRCAHGLNGRTHNFPFIPQEDVEEVGTDGGESSAGSEEPDAEPAEEAAEEREADVQALCQFSFERNKGPVIDAGPGVEHGPNATDWRFINMKKQLNRGKGRAVEGKASKDKVNLGQQPCA